MRLSRTVWPLALLIPLTCFAYSKHHPTRFTQPKPLIPFHDQVVTVDMRFAPLEETRCTAFLPPRLVAGRGADFQKPVVIDFIVGRSGNVEKPVILEGADPAVNLDVLDVVSGWHYRPAMCDGLPIEAEGRVELGSQVRN